MTHDRLNPADSYAPQLERCQILHGLDENELQSFLERVEFQDFASGAEILVEGERHQGLWILIRGRCDVAKRCESRDSQLAFLEPGSVFGEMSFFQPAPHSASVIAVDDVQTMRLSREGYDQLRMTNVQTAEKIACNIIQILSDRLRRMDQWTCRVVEDECDQRRHEEWQEFRARLYTDLFD